MNQLTSILNDTKAFYKFCNALRCPLCGHQLDGNIKPAGAGLYCSSHPGHYRATYDPTNLLPSFEKQTVYYNEFSYELISQCVNHIQEFDNFIYQLDLKLNAIIRNREKKLLFHNKGSKFSFIIKDLSESEFLNKVKIYNLFS